MLSAEINPAIKAFVAQIESEFVLAQVLISYKEEKFHLRHIEDRDVEKNSLRAVALEQLRQLAQSTGTGAFRPLKSSPNLQRGWRCEPRDESELNFALNQLYPGAVADWLAVQKENPPVTNYREFTARQSGMYRITTFLDDTQAAQMIRACCHKSFCLKRRLWGVENLAPDSASEKSAIPCLEPCAILLEFARKVVRLDQEEKSKPAISKNNVIQLCADARRELENPDPQIAESDFDSPKNPRRLQFLLEKYCAVLQPTAQ